MKNPLLGKIVIGGSPTVGHNPTISREPGLKTAILEQLSPTFAEYRFDGGAYSAGSKEK